MDKLRSLSTRELKRLLKARGLSQGCKIKEDLVLRLYEAFANGPEKNNLSESVDKELSGRQSDESDQSSKEEEKVAEETVVNIAHALASGLAFSAQETVSFLNISCANSTREAEGRQSQTGSEEVQLATELNSSESGKLIVNQHKAVTMTEKNTFVFKDIEDSLEPFSGETGKRVLPWLKEFEDIAAVCSWNEIQKYLYARRLLKGAARLAVEGSSNLHSWKSLKEFLENEFDDKPSAISIHRALESRKKRSDETYLEYLYSMKQIGNRGVIDDKSLVVYIIEGIQDDISNKLTLYEAKTLSELKEKLKAYEIMRNQKKRADNSSISKRDKFVTSNKKSRCGNCGATSHPSSNCPHRSKGSRCFTCNEFGHISPNCPRKGSKNIPSTSGIGGQVNFIAASDLRIEVSIGDQKLVGIVDTGSDVTLVRESVARTIMGPDIEMGPSICLAGFGQNLKTTKGSITVNNMQIQSGNYDLKCHVIPDAWISQDILIGKGILKDAKVTFEEGSVSLSRLERRDEECGEVHLSKIDLVELVKDTGSDPLEEIACKEYREQIGTLVQNYSPQKPNTSCIQMKICLEDEAPVHQKPRRLALVERELVAKQIREWLDDNIIRPSTSDFASPIVLTKKKDGSHRLCIDYRQLNNKIIKDRYPLPVIEDILENLYDARVFTTLDLRNGFFHVDISEESRKYTSFVTPDGQYEFLKAPFGLCNSPSVFQRYINKVFYPLMQKNVLLVYMDDIIIPTKSEEENIAKLRLTLGVAEQCGLEIKWKKCKFLKRRIEFLGHIVEEGKIRPSTEKITAVMNFPEPQNIQQVQSFLGLSGFFRKFIPNYSVIAKPLSDLLKANAKFVFDAQPLESFNQLKNYLCSDPVLKLFNPSRETELHTDASRVGYGAVLLQKDPEDKKFHPVFFLSYKTNQAEMNYSSYELEVLAIIKSLKKLRTYLLGLHFTIYTDCKAFHLTMKKKELNSRIARWALALEEYDCKVLHRSGSSMRHADALSRCPTICTIECKTLQEIKRAQDEDEQCRLVKKLLEKGEHENYCLRNEVLYKFDEGDFLLVVPILRDIHNQGHINARKVEALAKQDYFIPDVKTKIQAVLVNCVPCILSSRKAGKQEGYLHAIDKMDTPLHTFHADHLGPLASTAKGYKYLFVVIDAFTKFCWIFPTKDTTAEEALKRLVSLSEVFGNPVRIITDRGAAFTSNSFQSYCEEQKINQILVTTGVPRGNGQVERLNRTIIETLSKLAVGDPTKWYKFVPRLQRLLNSTVSRSTGRTPFELMVGVKMRRQEDQELLQALEEEIIEKFEDDRNEMRREAKNQIVKVQEENRRYWLRKRKPAQQYRVRDMVAIRRTQFLPGSKLFPKFLGPYEVSKVRGKDRYELKKVGEHEGPNVTSSSADNMKRWAALEGDSSSEADELQDGRM